MNNANMITALLAIKLAAIPEEDARRLVNEYQRKRKNVLIDIALTIADEIRKEKAGQLLRSEPGNDQGESLITV